MARRLACSDIHGEGHRLLQVLEQTQYQPGIDRLFLLGDYIDRGTDSKRTVEIVRELQCGGAICLLGNHDAWALDAVVDPEHVIPHWFTQGGDTTWRDFDGMPPADVLAWLRTLPRYHEEPDCILVHAGLKPGTPLHRQRPDDLIWIRKDFHVHYRGKRVVFGHTPTPVLHGVSIHLNQRNIWDVWHGPNKTGIDTGAAYGGRLTLYDLDTHQTWWA